MYGDKQSNHGCIRGAIGGQTAGMANGSILGSAQSPTPQSPIEQEIARAQSALSDLNYEAEALLKQLEPVLAHDTVPPCDEGVDTSPASPLCDRIRAMTIRVQTVVRTLSNTRGRLVV